MSVRMVAHFRSFQRTGPPFHWGRVRKKGGRTSGGVFRPTEHPSKSGQPTSPLNRDSGFSHAQCDITYAVLPRHCVFLAVKDGKEHLHEVEAHPIR